MKKLFFYFILLFSMLFNGVSFAETLPWLNGRLPAESKTEGRWFWDNKVKDANMPSHTDGVAEGLHSHSFATERPIRITPTTRIIQYIILDADNPPSGIMISFSTTDDKEKELILYWEGEEEVFKDKYTASWYMGFLPEKGAWVSLQIDCGEFDITDTKLNGASFITSGGRSWWGRTIIIND